MIDHSVVTLNQNALLKSYIDMNTDLSKKENYDLEKYFLKLMKCGFWKNDRNLRKLRGIKLVTTEERSYIVSKLNYHSTKFFAEYLLAIEIKKN